MSEKIDLVVNASMLHRLSDGAADGNTALSEQEIKNSWPLNNFKVSEFASSTVSKQADDKGTVLVLDLRMESVEESGVDFLFRRCR